MAQQALRGDSRKPTRASSYTLGQEKMLGISLLLLALGLVVFAIARLRGRTADEFVWRTESIRATVVTNDEHLFGQFLNLDQELRPRESGWTNMKICMPEHWRVRSVLVDDGRVSLVLFDGSRYVLSRDNIGKLSFAIDDGGPGKSAEILEGIWSRHALEKA